jgi:hypothetical protein
MWAFVFFEEETLADLSGELKPCIIVGENLGRRTFAGLIKL